MKLIIIHGDDSFKSYKAYMDLLRKLRKDKKHIVRLAKNDSLENLLRSKTLFETQRFVIIDDPYSVNDKSLKWLKENKDSLNDTLIIYYNKNIKKTFLKKLPKPDKIMSFDVPKLIWSFFESFYPGNTTNCLKLFNEVAKNEPPEFIFALFARHLRDLFWSGQENSHKQYPSWRLKKLKNQARKFENGSIKHLIKELAEIDIKTKTSGANVKDELDFLIMSKLE